MRHRGAPRATEAHPLVDAERLAQLLEVLQQVRVRVRARARVGARARVRVSVRVRARVRASAMGQLAPPGG